MAVALCTSVSPLAAQVIKGRVVLAGTEQALADVLVLLRFPDGRQAGSVVTDSAGDFRLQAPRLGAFTLGAEREGMRAISTAALQLRSGEAIEVVLRMAAAAVPLEPLIVTARSSIQLGMLAGYFERIERQQLLGFGHIMTRDQIEERQALEVADLLRDIPRISIVQGAGRMTHVLFRGGRGECTPKVYIDGMHQNRGHAVSSAAVVDEIVRPYELEGLEVYRGIGEMPAEFYDETHCGVILLWTRRDTDGGRPFTWRRLIAGAGLAAVFVLLAMR